MKWWTVIARYNDEPQTVADWVTAATAIAAANRVSGERDGAFVLAVVEGRVKLEWTPEDEL